MGFGKRPSVIQLFEATPHELKKAAVQWFRLPIKTRKRLKDLALKVAEDLSCTPLLDELEANGQDDLDDQNDFDDFDDFDDLDDQNDFDDLDDQNDLDQDDLEDSY